MGSCMGENSFLGPVGTLQQRLILFAALAGYEHEASAMQE